MGEWSSGGGGRRARSRRATAPPAGPDLSTRLAGSLGDRPVGETPASPSAAGPRGGRHAAPHDAGPLAAATVLPGARHRAQSGWRRALAQLTGGAIDPGPSAEELREQELQAHVRVPVDGCYRIAVLSLKGGVGKTTTAVGLGSAFASLRGDRVVAVDANPDRGTLADRVLERDGPTVQDLLAAREELHGYLDVRAFTSQSASRLEIVGSERDPARSVAFSEQDYVDTLQVLERFYSLVITDCGTGLLHSAMGGVLDVSDALVVVSSASLDGALSAAATLDWLQAHGYSELVEGAVTVLSAVRPGTTVDVDALEAHFRTRCRAVQRIPFDRHLQTGGEIDPDRLSPATRRAYLELAAAVADGMTRRPGAGR